MKTKTIYHLDQDCNVVRIEVVEKRKKSKNRPIVINLERVMDYKEFNQRVTNHCLSKVEQAHQQVLKAFS